MKKSQNNRNVKNVPGVDTNINGVPGVDTNISNISGADVIISRKDGFRNQGGILQDIPIQNGYAIDEGSTLDLPDGYWSGKNMIPFNNNGYRAPYLPASDTSTFSGVFQTLFIFESGLSETTEVGEA